MYCWNINLNLFVPLWLECSFLSAPFHIFHIVYTFLFHLPPLPFFKYKHQQHLPLQNWSVPYHLLNKYKQYQLQQKLGDQTYSPNNMFPPPTVPIIRGTLGMVNQVLEKRLEELEIRWKIEIILTPTLLRSAWILRRVLETRGDLLLPRL